jgi:hypothetical protein
MSYMDVRGSVLEHEKKMLRQYVGRQSTIYGDLGGDSGRDAVMRQWIGQRASLWDGRWDGEGRRLWMGYASE